MKRIQLTGGFSISIVDDDTPSVEVHYSKDGHQITGSLFGKKNIQELRKQLTELIGRRPLLADGVKMRQIADMVEREVPGMAFVLLIAEFGGPHGLSNYISNGDREDCIKWLRETADRIEKNSSFQTPNHN